MDKLVSIVIPCYRGERYLAGAIRSCLQQTYSNVEVIVVDDASPDGCREIAAGFADIDSRVRLVVRPSNGGVARAFNSGFEVARGRYFTRLAQDDEFEPHAVEKLVAQLEGTSSEAGLVYSDYDVINEDGEFLRRVELPPPCDALQFRNQIGLSVMWTRDVWNSVGSFDPTCDAAEDFDYWLRIAARFELTKLEGDSVMRIRMHPEMGSIRHANKQLVSTLRAVKRAYGEKRISICGWRRRQLALGCARMTAAYILADQLQYWMSLQQVLLSLAEWPFPFPKGANFCRLARVRALASLTRRILSTRQSVIQ